MPPPFRSVLALAILAASPLVAQSQPDFSGHWVLMRPENAGSDVPRALTIEQPVVRRNLYGEPIKPGFLQITIERQLAAEDDHRHLPAPGRFGPDSRARRPPSDRAPGSPRPFQGAGFRADQVRAPDAVIRLAVRGAMRRAAYRA